MLEEILSRENMTLAYKRVVSNKGSAGVDGVAVKALGSLMNTSWVFIKAEILEGTYKPKSVKRVVIPKPSGGTRQLGVPTTTDRLIQQSISQVLSKHYDKSFSNTSYGFRPRKNAHQASEQAQSYLNEGNKRIVDIDLERFFDTVNHDYLMHLQRLDEWIRSRLRYCIWKQWKCVRTKFKALVKLGIDKRKAYEWANTRKGGWRIVHSFILTRTITNKRLKEKGYISLIEMYSKRLLT